MSSARRNPRRRSLISPTSSTAYSPVLGASQPQSPFRDRVISISSGSRSGSVTPGGGNYPAWAIPDLSLEDSKSDKPDNMREAPPTFAQRFLLFDLWNRFEEEAGTVYNYSAAFTVRGKLDKEKLAHCWGQLVQVSVRHHF